MTVCQREIKNYRKTLILHQVQVKIKIVKLKKNVSGSQLT
uniref:Uncharacterized protein n=1 Tax=Arundo donax TaxID=35708 RepID=A0A0A8ZWW8_ARUDO